jgi:hypothetical protein
MKEMKSMTITMVTRSECRKRKMCARRVANVNCYICVCVCVYIYIYIYIYIWLVCACVYAYVYTYVYDRSDVAI